MPQFLFFPFYSFDYATVFCVRTLISPDEEKPILVFRNVEYLHI